MKLNRTNLISLMFVFLSFGATIALYGRLPEKVPTHWNAAGVPDGFSPKPWGPFMLPGITLVLYLVMVAIPRISPKGFSVEKFRRVFEVIQLSIIAFMFLVTILALLAGVGAPVPMDRAIHAGVGLLFIVLGNFMGKVTKNFFVGIRTPWTLANDEVWLRTHRLGGKCFVVGGLILLVSALLGGGSIAVLLAAGLAAGVPAIYSYVLYRRLENGSHDTTKSKPT